MSASQVKVLSLPATLANGPGILSPTVIFDDTAAILFDAGLPGMADTIRAEMEKAGVPFTRLTHIAITHSDTDHIGSVARLLADGPQKIQVVCHEAERKYVECDVPPLRLSQMEATIGNSPEELRPRMAELVASLKANYWRFKANVDRAVTDGDSLPCGVEVIYTPGHTPGHLCYYHRPSRTLVAGDMLNVEDGRLVGAPRFTMLDPEAWRRSAEKLTGVDVRTVVCYHGGVYDRDANGRIAELAASWVAENK